MLGFVPSKRDKAFLRQITLVMGQRNQLVWDIPALDSFELNRAIYRIPAADFRRMLDELTELLELGPLLQKPVRNLSLGERMKCEIAAALLHRPQVVFLDEPTIGLDVTMQRRIRTFIAEYNRRFGATVLLTSHYMADVEALCRRVIVIHHGKLLFDGDLSALVQKFTAHKTIVVQLDDMPGRPARLRRSGLLRGRAYHPARPESRDRARHRAPAGRPAGDRPAGRGPAHRGSHRAGLRPGGLMRDLGAPCTSSSSRPRLPSMLQYRASLFIWMIGQVLEPLIYLVVWSTVSDSARRQRGRLHGRRSSRPTSSSSCWSTRSPIPGSCTSTNTASARACSRSRCCRPVHPIHADIADNISSKLITLPVMLVIAAGLALIFKPAAVASYRGPLLAFVPALLLAFLLRFLVEWTLAQAAFWTTRVSAINQVYFVLMLFLSGQIAPLSLFPGPIQVAGGHPALPLDDRLSGGAVLGRLTPVQALTGLAAQAVWLVHQPGAGAARLAGGHAHLFGGGRMNYLRLFWRLFPGQRAGGDWPTA